MAHGINVAAFEALGAGAITSASVMVPCGFFEEVVAQARQRPDWDLGVHLTLTSEWKEGARWGPISPSNVVPSLLDPDGYFWPDNSSFATHAVTDQVALEVDAQVCRALDAGLSPTHVDCHMFSLLGRPDLLATYIGIARKHKLPFLVSRDQYLPLPVRQLVRDDDVVLDSCRSASVAWLEGEWQERYLQVVSSLSEGVNQLIVHLGFDDAEMQAVAGRMTAWDGRWRQRDFDLVMSDDFRSCLKKSGVRLATWRGLR